MKIKVEYSESIQISEGMWRKIGVEVSGDDWPGSDIRHDEAESLHASAKEYVQRWHREAATSIFGETYTVPHNGTAMPGTEPKVTIINRKYDEMKDIIADCLSLEELAKHKEYCSTHSDLMPYYMNKLKELTKI